MGCSSSKSTYKVKFDVRNHQHTYDIIIIGGGSGGLSCAREASKLGARVALCDYVTPSPKGSRWGLGGTCVNVGCIPKKLLHQSNIIKDFIGDASLFGWTGLPEQPSFSWETLIKNVQEYIFSLNSTYRSLLTRERIEFLKGIGSFVDEHTIKVDSPGGASTTITGQCIVIAVGGRPKYLTIPGGTAKDNLCITSDDIFSLDKPPGKTLCVGAGYISVECAGFLAGFGYDVTLMARSVILRNFDQSVVDLLTANLIERNVRIVRDVEPRQIVKTSGGKLKVKWKPRRGGEKEEDFDTVLLAVGREPFTKSLNLSVVDAIKVNDSGEIITDEAECTGVPHIFAIGDCAQDRPKLTPSAIVAGQWLARRLYGKLVGKSFSKFVDYSVVPTTIFTPIEYGECGITEKDALEKYGRDRIEIFQKSLTPLEFVMNKRDREAMYAKLICLKAGEPDDAKVLGLHYFGPNAGDVTLGFSMAVKNRCKKKEFNELVGIHPTCAEIFCEMVSTKNSYILQERGC